MPILATMGIKALYYKRLTEAEIKAGTMPTSGFSAVDVYQDTGNFTQADGNSTTHKSETSSKKITLGTKGDKSLVFSIMDPSKQERADFEGGTYTPESGTGDSKVYASYEEPEGDVPIKMAFIVLPDEGDALHIVRANVIGKINTTYSKTGITLLEVTATPEVKVKYTEDPRIPGVAATA